MALFFTLKINIENIPPVLSSALPLISIMTGTILISVYTVPRLLKYLQPDSQETSPDEPSSLSYEHDLFSLRQGITAIGDENRKMRSELLQQVHDLYQRLSGMEARRIMLSDAEKKGVVDTIKTNLQSETAQAVLAEIEHKVEERTKPDSRAEHIGQHFEATRKRLHREILALTKRGNLNLILGVFITILGLGFLIYYVLFENKSAENGPWPFISHFAPRLTLVVFIEIFAYFFLSLYKSSLAEIKYFQNEMTNVECRFIALRTAIISEYEDSAKQVITELGKTERNHVLEKGQTTVELEKARLEKDMVSDLAQNASETLKKKS